MSEVRNAYTRPTIVVVDDDAANLDLIQTILASDPGLTLVKFVNSSKALAYLRDTANRVDLLLTDLVMPGKNGAELARAAKIARPSLQIILMSGDTQGIDIADLFLDGATLLAKPFNMGTLRTVIRSKVGGSTTTL